MLEGLAINAAILILAAATFHKNGMTEVAELGKAVDREEWDMNAQTVNASYNPLMNQITFPAGIPFHRLKSLEDEWPTKGKTNYTFPQDHGYQYRGYHLDALRRPTFRYQYGDIAVEADWPDALRVNRWLRGLSDDPDAVTALDDFRRFPNWMWRNTDVVGFLQWLRAFNDATEKGRWKDTPHTAELIDILAKRLLAIKEREFQFGRLLRLLPRQEFSDHHDGRAGGCGIVRS